MFRSLAIAVLSTVLVASPALAADPEATAFVHIGLSHLKQADDARMFANGIPVPGAGFTTEPDLTQSVEVGLFLREGFAVAASAMLPVSTPNMAAGTIAGLGNLGDETVGFYSATAQYHVAITDVITPYVGVGVGYMHIFDTTDGAVTDISVESAFGAVLQVGVDVQITDMIGVFADIKNYRLTTNASGTLGGVPITAIARVDPWVVSTGIGVNF